MAKANREPEVEIVVHVLRHGLAVCKFSVALPKDWPAGHRWVYEQQRDHVTCVDCRIAYGWRLPELGEAEIAKLVDPEPKSKEPSNVRSE